MRLAACFCLLAGLTVSAANASQKVILYGDDDYAPYCFVENGQFKGMYVDILNLAIQKLKPDYDVELKPRPWKRGLAELESGFSFGLFPPGLKRERTYVQPYSVPIYRETVVLFCNDAVMKGARKVFPDDFSGLKIGVNAGFLLSGRLIEAANAGIVTLEESKGNDGNLRKLGLERIDCYASDRGAALYTAKKLNANPETAIAPLREAVELSGEDTYIGYSVHNNPPYKADFIKKMNAAIESVKKSGATAKIENGHLR